MVSVILCTYNDSHLLLPAIESCLEQDTDVEVVLVDDASQKPIVPEVLELINQNQSIRLIRHEKNRGLSAARNTGIAAASNELIIPLDADDHFFPNVLGKMEREFDQETDVVYGNLWVNNAIDYPCAQPFLKCVLKKVNPLFCSSMFRKKLWDKVGGYLVREGAHYEDWQFWNKCFMAGACFKYIDLVVYEHAEHSDSMLRKLEKEKEKYIQIATEVLGG